MFIKLFASFECVQISRYQAPQDSFGSYINLPTAEPYYQSRHPLSPCPLWSAHQRNQPHAPHCQATINNAKLKLDTPRRQEDVTEFEDPCVLCLTYRVRLHEKTASLACCMTEIPSMCQAFTVCLNLPLYHGRRLDQGYLYNA